MAGSKVGGTHLVGTSSVKQGLNRLAVPGERGQMERGLRGGGGGGRLVCARVCVDVREGAEVVVRWLVQWLVRGWYGRWFEGGTYLAEAVTGVDRCAGFDQPLGEHPVALM